MQPDIKKGFCNFTKKDEYAEKCQMYAPLYKLSICEQGNYFLCRPCFDQAQEEYRDYDKLSVSERIQKRREELARPVLLTRPVIPKNAQVYIPKEPEKIFTLKYSEAKEIQEMKREHYHKYTIEEINWFRENSKNKSINQIVQGFEKQFNTRICSKESLRIKLNTLGIEYRKIKKDIEPVFAISKHEEPETVTEDKPSSENFTVLQAGAVRAGKNIYQKELLISLKNISSDFFRSGTTPELFTEFFLAIRHCEKIVREKLTEDEMIFIRGGI
jgi:hypothetical protein